MKISSLLLLFLICFFHYVSAQNSVSIPAYTAYAVPAEDDEIEETNMFNTKDGLHNWRNPTQQIQFYFNCRNTGKLNLALLLKTNIAGNILSVTVAGKSFRVQVPASSAFKKIVAGSVNITAPGFYSVLISCVSKKEKNIADIKSLELSGDAIKNIHFNNKERRNAASVHLLYSLADSMQAVLFYNELTIPAGNDVVHSYYMACGFARGYFGMQVNSSTERRIIFSVWDAGNESVDRNKVTTENRVELMAKGEGVFADDFGNEGTGGHSHWLYNWKAGETYKFVVTAATDSASRTTSYAGYFFIPQLQQWKLIACFKAPKDGKPLRSLYSFSENFVGTNGQLIRKAFFGNQWVRGENGEWKELTESKFSYDATGKAGDRIDYGAGTDSNRFYLWHGGFAAANIKYGDTLTRFATDIKPVIDFYKNADSSSQAAKELTSIRQYINASGDSTWKENEGVHYKILKKGSGNFVKLTDTIIVHYKGYLLNGAVFDETKNEPATFPLNRLIKGYQRALPFCRVGGKIRLIIPSALAYSIRNISVIPPNNILVFDVEVLDAKQ
ncbi:hypothetical protein BH10BAC3_BH10BAC3_06270 [soil metagenome]